MDLLQDWERRGRRLDVDEVTILVRKRTLTAGAHARILATLTDLGVLDDPEDSSQMPVRQSKRGQPRLDDAIAVFLHDVSSRPLIRAEDEVRLGRSIQAGRLARQQLLTPTNPEDRSALELVIQRGLQAHAQLVEANLRLVVSVAKKSGLGNDLAFEDRIQCGNLGLLRAADKFDPELGYKFSTYATWWIRQAISRGNADTGRAIRLPVHAHEALSKLRTARRRLERSGRNDPSLSDVATEARIDVVYARALTDWAHDLVSLDQPLAEGDITLVDFYADRTAHPDDDPITTLLRVDLVDHVERWLTSGLTTQQYDVITRRHGFETGDPETLASIADDWGVTRERIRQIQTQTTQLLSEHADGMYEYYLDDTTLDRPAPPAAWVQGVLAKRKKHRRPNPTASSDESRSR